MQCRTACLLHLRPCISFLEQMDSLRELLDFQFFGKTILVTGKCKVWTFVLQIHSGSELNSDVCVALTSICLKECQQEIGILQFAQATYGMPRKPAVPSNVRCRICESHGHLFNMRTNRGMFQGLLKPKSLGAWTRCSVAQSETTF